MNTPNKPHCDDCNKAQQPIYQVSYAHPTIEICNVVTGSKRIVPGKQITKQVCSKCVSIYEKAAAARKEGDGSEVVL
jgi:hypothetical protein